MTAEVREVGFLVTVAQTFPIDGRGIAAVVGAVNLVVGALDRALTTATGAPAGPRSNLQVWRVDVTSAEVRFSATAHLTPVTAAVASLALTEMTSLSPTQWDRESFDRYAHVPVAPVPFTPVAGHLGKAASHPFSLHRSRVFDPDQQARSDELWVVAEAMSVPLGAADAILDHLLRIDPTVNRDVRMHLLRELSLWDAAAGVALLARSEVIWAREVPALAAREWVPPRPPQDKA